MKTKFTDRKKKEITPSPEVEKVDAEVLSQVEEQLSNETPKQQINRTIESMLLDINTVTITLMDKVNNFKEYVEEVTKHDQKLEEKRNEADEERKELEGKESEVRPQLKRKRQKRKSWMIKRLVRINREIMDSGYKTQKLINTHCRTLRNATISLAGIDRDVNDMDKKFNEDKVEKNLGINEVNVPNNHLLDNQNNQNENQDNRRNIGMLRLISSILKDINNINLTFGNTVAALVRIHEVEFFQNSDDNTIDPNDPNTIVTKYGAFKYYGKDSLDKKNSNKEDYITSGVNDNTAEDALGDLEDDIRLIRVIVASLMRFHNTMNSLTSGIDYIMRQDCYKCYIKIRGREIAPKWG